MFINQIKQIVILIVLLVIMTVPTFTQVKPDVAQVDFGQYEVAVQNIKPSEGIPNFAGHYILSSWRCGERCYQFGIIDIQTNKVMFPAQLQNIKSVSAETSVQFKNDSRLLIILEPVDNKTITKTFYEWNGSKLQKITKLYAQKSVVGTENGVILPIFESLIAKVTNGSEVPLLLPLEIQQPKYLPKLTPLPEGATKVPYFSNIQILSKTEYDLTIDLTPDCLGRPNCNYGHISGIKNSTNTPVSSGFIKYDSKISEPVVLSNRIKGFYIPAPQNPRATSGASVFWFDESGNQYAVSLKRVSKEDIIELANAVIRNSEGIYKSL